MGRPPSASFTPAGEDVVYVQQDGAPGHTAKKTPELLAAAGLKRMRGEPRIELVQRPAQSPDLVLWVLSVLTDWLPPGEYAPAHP